MTAAALAAPSPASAETADEPKLATGFVFDDANANGVRDEGEAGIPGVAVSNKREVVVTDTGGRWVLPVEGDDTAFFVIKPRGWMVPVSADQLPRFYYLHKPNGSPRLKFAGVPPTGPLPASIDFPLMRREEPEQLQVVLFGDPQPRNLREVGYIARDVVPEVMGTDAAFGVTLGDITFDNLSLFEPQAEAIGLIGIPWFNVIGNHDINYDGATDDLSDESFERVFGPSYYAFDWGPAHFIVLDNIVWDKGGPLSRSRYYGGLDDRQLAFIESDLALVPKERWIVLLMHVPLPETKARRKLYRLIEDRPHTLSISAHRHFQRHLFIGEADGWKGAQPHHHLIHATVSGNWWGGAPDERGIPHATMVDGAPNGWSTLSLEEGGRYVIDFKAAARPASEQISIFAPFRVKRGELAAATIYANVYAGSERSVVEMRMGEERPWQAMRREVRKDPMYEHLVKRDADLQRPWNPSPAGPPSHHLWRGSLPADLAAGRHLIEIRTIDQWGRIFRTHRVIEVH
jgi:hypothetical protein